jgi:hypothetical protein
MFPSQAVPKTFEPQICPAVNSQLLRRSLPFGADAFCQNTPPKTHVNSPRVQNRVSGASPGLLGRRSITKTPWKSAQVARVSPFRVPNIREIAALAPEKQGKNAMRMNALGTMRKNLS